jgi:hypothetical protein
MAKLGTYNPNELYLEIPIGTFTGVVTFGADEAVFELAGRDVSFEKPNHTFSGAVINEEEPIEARGGTNIRITVRYVINVGTDDGDYDVIVRAGLDEPEILGEKIEVTHQPINGGASKARAD